jgi:hypothetical protein
MEKCGAGVIWNCFGREQVCLLSGGYRFDRLVTHMGIILKQNK